MALAGRAAVAADRRAPVRSLQRSDADHGGAGRLYQRHRVGVVFARCGHCRAAVRCGRAPGASCRTGARHRAGAGSIAAGRLATAVVPAAGTGWAGSRTDIARGQRSVRAAGQIAVSDLVGIVARVAVAGVFLNEDDETLHALTVIVILRGSGVSSTPRLL